MNLFMPDVGALGGKGGTVWSDRFVRTASSSDVPESGTESGNAIMHANHFLTFSYILIFLNLNII